MAGSILDIGKIVELDLRQQQMQEQQRHNDLYEQHLQTEKSRQAETEAAHLQREKFKKFELGIKLLDDPMVPRDFRAKILGTIAKEAEYGDLTPEQLLASEPELKKMTQGLLNGDKNMMEEGLTAVMYQYPGLTIERLTMLEKAQGLAQKASEHLTNLQLNQARLENMHEEHTSWQAAHNEYRPVVETLDAHLNQFGDLGQSLYAKSPQARKALLAGNPTVKKLVDEARDRSGVSAMMETEAKKELAYWEAQQRAIDQGESTLSPDIVAIRTESAKQVIRARQSEQKWLNGLRQDTWDKAAFTELKQVREQLNASVTGAKAKMKSISDDRLALQERKFDMQQDYDARVKAGQSELLKRHGFTWTGPELGAIVDTYKVKADDLTKGLGDPTKKGRVEIGLVKMGQEDASRQFKAIEAAQGVVDYVADLRERIQANPAIIGRGAQLATAMAGAGQQLRAIVKSDPSASKVLNTKTRDESEAAYELLVYLQARAMDPSGPLDLKVVENARKVLGDLNSFSTGPQQMLNKLQVVQTNAERNIRRARQRIKGGVEAYINEPSQDKAVSEMSEEELLQTILGGRTP